MLVEQLRREARPRDGEGATSRRATTSGTRACSSPAPTCCSSSWASPSPKLLAGLLELADAWDTPRRGAVVDQVWPELKKIAIDYTVAEPAAAAGKLAVVPGHFTWDDVGDFASIAKLHAGGRKADLAILGENRRILADQATGVVISQSKRLITLIGVEDIVVVDTDDALLVTTTAHAQRVKSVVDALKLGGSSDVL